MTGYRKFTFFAVMAAGLAASGCVLPSAEVLEDNSGILNAASQVAGNGGPSNGGGGNGGGGNGGGGNGGGGNGGGGNGGGNNGGG